MADISLVLFISAILVFLVDQLSKWFMAKIFQERILLIRPFVQIKLIINKHAILASQRLLLLAAWVFVAIWVTLLISRGLFFQNREAQLGLGFALGGAMSNLVDQTKKGGIIDFIGIPSWGMSNFADLAIVLGLCLAFWFR
jgi:lipoprotein signal peptidase